MNLMELRLITIDSFTQCRFGGNPAAVVPECEEVPQMYYPQIANEINLSQSAFIHRRSADRFFIEFFTPTQEIKFSGHAAIGAFYVLSNMGYIRPQESGIKKAELELSQGDLLDVSINYEDYEVDKISIGMPSSSFKMEKEEEIQKQDLADLIRVDESEIRSVYLGGYFSQDLIVFLETKEALDNAMPDFFDLINLSEERGFSGLYLLYVGKNQSKNFAYARYFSPAIGFYEEAATGSAAAAAGKIILDESGDDKITIYQGQTMKRPSVIEVSRSGDEISLSGIARIVTDSIMHL